MKVLVGGGVGLGPKVGAGVSVFWGGDNTIVPTLPFLQDDQWIGIAPSVSFGVGLEGSVAVEATDTYYFLLTPNSSSSDPEPAAEVQSSSGGNSGITIEPQSTVSDPLSSPVIQADEEPCMCDMTDPAEYSNYGDYTAMQDESLSEEYLMDQWALEHGWVSIPQ